jgi:hypothetical protein
MDWALLSCGWFLTDWKIWELLEEPPSEREKEKRREEQYLIVHMKMTEDNTQHKK